MSKNKIIVTTIGIFIFLVAAIGWLAWLGGEPENEGIKSVSQEEQKNSATSIGEDWKTYKNEKYGFELAYPKEWFVYERNNGEKRIYIQTALGEVNKETSPVDFRRIWIAYDSEEGEEIPYNLSGAEKYTAVNNSIEMNFYEWPANDTNSEPSMEVYWNNDGIKFKADCASEVGAENARQEVEMLKKILTTFRFVD